MGKMLPCTSFTHSPILHWDIRASMPLWWKKTGKVYRSGQKKTNWASYTIGCIAGFVPWVVIFIPLISGIMSSESSIPDFVIAIFISIAIFFNVFAINMYLQYKKIGKWKDYIHGEQVYIVLSLFAKSALAWQVFAGTLRPA